MKKITFYISLLAAGVIVFSACKKEAAKTADFTTTEGSAFLRVVHAAPSFRKIFNLPDSFNVYVNGGKINSPFFTYGSIFPGTASNSGYVAVPPGLQQVKLSVHGFASASSDSTLLTNFTKVFVKGEYYTLLVTDDIKSARDSSQIFIRDAQIKPTSGNAGLRFVNAVLNDTAGKSIEFFSYARNATLSSAMLPGGITSFSSFGYNAAVPDTIYVTRPAAAGTPIANRIVLAKGVFSPANQRLYTVYYRGDGNLTTGTKARGISAFVH